MFEKDLLMDSGSLILFRENFFRKFQTDISYLYFSSAKLRKIKQKTNKILYFLHDKRRYDFTDSRLSMLERRVTKRLFQTKSKNSEEFYG